MVWTLIILVLLIFSSPAQIISIGFPDYHKIIQAVVHDANHAECQNVKMLQWNTTMTWLQLHHINFKFTSWWSHHFHIASLLLFLVEKEALAYRGYPQEEKVPTVREASVGLPEVIQYPVALQWCCGPFS